MCGSKEVKLGGKHATARFRVIYYGPGAESNVGPTTLTDNNLIPMRAVLLLALVALPHAAPAQVPPADEFASLSDSELLARARQECYERQACKAKLKSTQSAAVTPLDAAPKLGEAHGTKAGGFFSALQTSGSFTSA